MTLSRTVTMICVLAVLPVDSTAAQFEKSASVGENVLLPCPCSKAAVRVVWQVDGNLIVNHYNALKKDSAQPHDSFKNRSQLFLSREKENCSLLLLNVSSRDQRVFRCYTFTKSQDMDSRYKTNLTVTELRQESSTDTSPHKIHEGFAVGVPLSVVLLAGGVVGVLLLVIRRQRTQRVILVDPQAGLPMMNHSAV